VQNKHEFFFYYANICKHKHEKNMTKLWCKIVHKTRVEYTKGNEGSYSYLYSFGTKLKKTSKEISIYTSSNETFEKPS
jgi:hypothetical protein